MLFFEKNRFLIAGVIVVIVGVILLIMGYQAFKPLPDNTDLKTRFFSFSYPRIYDVEEYAPGVVTLGHDKGDAFEPLVEINRYQSDPESALPASFDAFMKRQAAALCGADSSIESVICTEVGVTAYTSPKGAVGQKLGLTLVRKNLKSGTTTSSTYGPMYVFNTTDTSTTTTRYSGIFIYPSLAAFLNGTTSPAIMDQVLNTFVLEN